MLNIENEILTLAEAAKYLKVSERTLWQLAKDGEIPHRRVGKQYRFVCSILSAWAKGEQVTQISSNAAQQPDSL